MFLYINIYSYIRFNLSSTICCVFAFCLHRDNDVTVPLVSAISAIDFQEPMEPLATRESIEIGVDDLTFLRRKLVPRRKEADFWDVAGYVSEIYDYLRKAEVSMDFMP